MKIPRGVNVFSRSKMGNVMTRYGGVTYHSMKEANYARELDARLRGKDISKWEGQVRFPIVINGQKICDYVADFVVTHPDGKQEVIDVKPFDRKTGKFLHTATFSLKRKLVEAIYGVRIIET